MAAVKGRPSSSADRTPWLLHLYPAAWRARYGEEFAELLAARPPRLSDRWDIVAGALDARLHPQVGQGVPSAAPVPRDRSVGGLVVVAGVLLTAWAMIGVLFMEPWADPTMPRMLAVSFVSGLVGSVLLAVALLLIASRYDWSIGAAGAVGGVLTGAGLVFSSLGGGVAALLLLVGGTVLLAWRLRGRLVGTVPALVLTATTMLVVGAFLAVAANDWTDPRPFRLLVLYGPAWMLVGVNLRAPARQLAVA
jgi:MFS family permease